MRGDRNGPARGTGPAGRGTKRMTSACLAAAAGLALAMVASPALASSESQIYLSWHAPYGAPGATRELAAACGDTSATDTLFLSCDVGTDSPTFLGFTGMLSVHAAPGDTLGPSWRLGKDSHAPRGVSAIWVQDPDHGIVAPWGATPGFGAIYYDESREAGSLQLIFAVPANTAPPIKIGTRFVLARLVFRRPPAGPACDRPVCIEWERATLSVMVTWDIDVSTGDRFVSWNSPGGGLCEGFGHAVRPKAWKPPASPGSR